MELQVTVDDSKAETLITFLKTLNYVEVKKTTAKKKSTEASLTKGKGKPSFSYFGSCPEWDVDAKDLRTNRAKGQW